jgi:N-acetylmuramoyl-L-alanine amidase
MEIKKMIIPNLPQIAYRKGKPEGVVAHSTATPEAPALNVQKFESRTWSKGFVHFAVDWNEIIQIADTKFIGYGAGKIANQRFIHVELCETKDASKFKKSYEKYVWLLAKLLKDNKLSINELWTHEDVSLKLGGTDHVDPVSYLKSHGISIAQLKKDVSKEMNSGKVTPVSSSVIGKLVVVDYDGKEGLNVRQRPDFTSKVIIRAKKGEAFTIVEELEDFYKIKSGLYITKSSKFVHVK